MGQGSHKAQMPYFTMTFPLTYKTLYPFILILASPKRGMLQFIFFIVQIDIRARASSTARCQGVSSAEKAMRRESCLDAIWTEEIWFIW